MAKRGRPRKGIAPLGVKEKRVGLYVMPNQRARLDWIKRRLGAESQNDALAMVLNAAGVPAEVAPEAPEVVEA